MMQLYLPNNFQFSLSIYYTLFHPIQSFAYHIIHEGTSPSVSLSFEWDTYQFVKLDELILVVCSVFAYKVHTFTHPTPLVGEIFRF
jgi:hypothetical protein